MRNSIAIATLEAIRIIKMGEKLSSQGCQAGRTILTLNQTDIIFNFYSCRAEAPPIYVEIQFLGGNDLLNYRGKPLNYHIHQFPQVNNTCSTTQGHYDPLKANKAPSKPYKCIKEDLYTCEKGDLSGKFGSLLVSEDVNSSSSINYIDYSLTLNEILGLSVVIHAPDRSKLACNNIELV